MPNVRRRVRSPCYLVDLAKRQGAAALGVVLLSIVVLDIIAPSVAEAALRPLNLEQLTDKSGFIVCGEVVEVKSLWGSLDGRGRVLLTNVRIRVSDVWKDTPGRRVEILRKKGPDGKTTANARIEEITVQYLGGAIGQRWQLCPESPRYEKGEKVVVFARVLNGRLWTTGWIQGKYRLAHQRSGGKTIQMVAGHAQLPIRKTQPLSKLRDRVGEIIRRQRALKASRGAAARPTAPRSEEVKR
jgi:hypothetical protein